MKGNTVLVANRVIMPNVLSCEALEALHPAQMGVKNLEAMAKEALFWPGMTKDITQTLKEVKACHVIAPMPMPIPDYSFQMGSSYYFYLESHKYVVFAYPQQIKLLTAK